jgi:hypothetical protein
VGAVNGRRVWQDLRHDPVVEVPDHTSAPGPAGPARCTGMCPTMRAARATAPGRGAAPPGRPRRHGTADRAWLSALTRLPPPRWSIFRCHAGHAAALAPAAGWPGAGAAHAQPHQPRGSPTTSPSTTAMSF